MRIIPATLAICRAQRGAALRDLRAALDTESLADAAQPADLPLPDRAQAPVYRCSLRRTGLHGAVAYTLYATILAAHNAAIEARQSRQWCRIEVRPLPEYGTPYTL